MIYFYSFTIKTNMKKDGERKKKYILVCLWLSAFMDLLQMPTDLKGATCFALFGVGGCVIFRAFCSMFLNYSSTLNWFVFPPSFGTSGVRSSTCAHEMQET